MEAGWNSDGSDPLERTCWSRGRNQFRTGVGAPGVGMGCSECPSGEVGLRERRPIPEHCHLREQCSLIAPFRQRRCGKFCVLLGL